MAYDIYSTYYMLASVREIPPVETFFLSRYFPTNAATDMFSTNKVLVEYMAGNKKLAPFVIPRAGGVSILRDGFVTNEFEPPNIAPSRPLTVDELAKRNFGEALYSQQTPAQRESFLLMDDLEELDKRITRREEWMAVQTILNNGCVMRHISDKADKYEEKEIRFYDEVTNPAVYEPDDEWDDTNGDFFGDVAAMANLLTDRGLAASDLVVSADVGDFILNFEKVQKLLDIRNYNIGSIAPRKLPEGTVYIGTLNFSGHMLDILVNRETYEDDNGTTQKYLPDGTAVVTAPNCGRTLYGAVTQMENDEKFYTHVGKRIPKYNADKKHNTREVILTAKPLCMPKQKNPWVVASNVLKA